MSWNRSRRVLAVTCLAAGFAWSVGAAADEKAPVTKKPADTKSGYWVKSAGEMRDVMMKGNLDAHFDLSTLRDTKGLYALGPVAGLQGEITVFDGKPSVTTLRDGKPVVGEAWPKACFLVYAQVEAWQTVPIPKEVETLEQLESFVLGAAKKAGLDVDKPFPFLVTGTPKLVKYHVIWKSDGLPHTKELHQKAKLGFELNEREVEMLGFYSDKHHGVFTHHDSNIHVHARATDGKDAGHVDALTLAGPMTLHLPTSAAPKKPAAEPQKGPGGKDAAFAADRDTFHFLLDNHKAIKRAVKKLDNGVETVTESDDAEVTKKIQEHVPAMYERLKSGNGVRYWDPLFAEAFKHGKKMKMTIENTKAGVKVVETSDDAEVVKVIQAHADVVSKFVEKGFEEARKEHPVAGPEKKK
jgi:acetolactate decarboxylase